MCSIYIYIKICTAYGYSYTCQIAVQSADHMGAYTSANFLMVFNDEILSSKIYTQEFMNLLKNS